MAENQSAASEDSGHQQQQQQQHQHQQQQQPPLASTTTTNTTSSSVNAASTAVSSLVNQSPTNSQASSPENSQEAVPLVRRQQSAATAAATAVAVAATSSNIPQQQHQQQRSSLSNMFDRTVNAKFKTSAVNAGPGQNSGRRNSMLTPAKGASVGGTGGNLRKLTKVNSLTRDYGLCYSPIPTIYQNSNNAGSNAATLQRTTSESLRLNSLNRVAAATSVSRATSNSSLSTATSTSTSLAPKSSSSSGSGSDATPQQQQQQQQPPASGNTSSSSSSSNSGDKASSPNNNGARAVGGAAAATAGTGTASHHHQPHHHHHHHHHHQHHHHQQQHPHQTSLSQGHASLTVAGMTGGASGSGSSGVAGAGSTTRKPKTTSSFEITSVTVGHPKLNAAGDTGDESADDLDESHTDDNSRITDLENETPSMSEDTFSKEEVYYANNALSPNAPVIPTSSQYGLVVVDPIGPSLGQTIQNVQVNVSDIINSVSAAVTPGGTKKKDDIKETQHRSERFKVVKIESTEPFKRGRWMCMDYLDHSSVGNGGNNNEKTGSSSEATTDGVGGSDAPPQKTTQSMILPPTQKLNENHLEANSTDANWNYAEQQSQQQQSSQQQHQQHSHQQQQSSQQQQQTQMSATPSGVMTAPATVVHGMHQLHMEAQQQQQQQQQLFDSVNANASSPNPQSVDTGNMGYALTAAMQLQQTLQQLKQREEAMESGYQNGGEVAGGAPNNNNSGGGGGPAAAATAESQLSTSYVEQQQQPLSPAPQTPQITPTFAAVAAGQAAPNFQLEQQQQQPQATSQIDGILPQSFPQQQQQQQQQTPQQSTPQQQAPPVAAAAATAGATAVPATQQQTSNTSNAAVTTGQGQTLPLISHMTSYEQQPSSAGAGANAAGSGTAATSVAVPSPAIPTLHLQSAPATIADPQQLMVPQQQQQQQEEQQQQQQQQIPPTNIASASANNSNLNLTNPNVEPTTNALPLTEEQVIAATTATGGAAKAASGATSTSAATQLQQLQQQPNAESETESFNTSAFPGGNRKRAFSNPHIGLVGGAAGGTTVDPGAFMHRLNPQLYYYNKSHSGRSSFCVDESLWPTNPNHNARASDTNLYMGSSTEEDYEEAIDQFSPTLYTRSGASRAIPIPTSAGNSPQRQLHPQMNPHQARIATGINSAAAAFSASPSIYAYPHSPFYASSPETSTLSSPVQMSGMAGHAVHSSRISFSYDPAFQRLQVPKPRSPLECASVFAAVAAAATCGGGGDPHQMGMATPVNSASGTSAVAIDNKIEQAMDLVKSHLMIAVREEVEVLKERISELMDKINKLELENNILKSNIPQETLQQLQMQLQIAGSQQPAAVAAPPATPAIQAPPTSAATAAGQAAAAAAAAVGAVTAAAVVGSTGAGATSPASAVAPTSIPNGSAENGSISAVSGSSGNNSDASIVEQVTAGAAAVPTVNGPMS